MHVLFKDHVLSQASPRVRAPAPRYNSCAAPQEFTNEEIDRELYEGILSPGHLLMKHQAPCQLNLFARGALPVALLAAITGQCLKQDLKADCCSLPGALTVCAAAVENEHMRHLTHCTRPPLAQCTEQEFEEDLYTFLTHRGEVELANDLRNKRINW